MSEDKLPVGQVLRALREHMGMTQREFGKITGVRQSTVWAVESGGYTPTLPTLLRIARVTGIPVWKIIRMAEKKIEVNAETAQESL
jgi:transcriptional regulator with XRE-family HTH domain